MVGHGKRFEDRRHAGIELAKLLEPAYKDRGALVLAIPRGGVAVAGEVASRLHAELSVVITKKLPYPLEEELAIGAVAEDGSVYLNELAGKLSPEAVRGIVEEQLFEIKSRVQRFRKGAALPAIKGRIAIVVDDGIATGSTLVPAMKLCRKSAAREVVAAAPVAGTPIPGEVAGLADRIVVVEQPEAFFAVGQVYADFHNLRDEEVIGVLTEFERGRGH